ncbi:larval cuticle protein LCP-17 [Drosophila novamexicana]|uniref:larval cuticle protein LCP-17 n=1 Tax=Drosophila novamexicana TaxID=47314 RepID=UPI0011E59A8C|nr:larval cuticle protein LCP-17 [Drosophila novamexicana]
MFKLFICLIVVASGVSGASIGSTDVTTEKREIVPLLRFETEKDPNGSFKFTYEGGDKSFREESGVLENAGTEDEALEVTGSYRYIDADGQLVEVHYTAGKNGFVPTGTHILSEITALAKAAADLPQYSEEQEREQRLSQRRARSKTEQTAEPVEQTKPAEPKAAAAEVVPVQVVQVEQKPVAAAVEKTDKVASKTA